MILAIQYWEGDMKQAMALARLMADLEDTPRKETVLFSARFDAKFDDETIAYVSKKFPVMKFRGCRQSTGWPDGPNQVMGETLTYCINMVRANQIDDDCVMFIEADCVPLKKGWLDDLQDEYRQSHKKCMGARIKAGRHGDHINGNMIMSLDMWKYAPGICNPPKKVAWDARFAKDIIPHSHSSRLIWSDYKYGEDVNPWRGDDWFWEPKVRSGETDVYKGEELYPVYFHGIKTMQGIDAVRKRLIPEKSLDNASA